MLFVGLSCCSSVSKIKKNNLRRKCHWRWIFKVKENWPVNGQGQGRHSNSQEKYVKSLREASVALWRSYK